MQIVVGGDTAPYGWLGRYVQHADNRSTFWAALRTDERWVGAAIRILNLEGSIRPSGGRVPSKIGPRVELIPDTIPLLAEGGVDLVTLANNHILDFGVQGLENTMAALADRGISHVGAGMTAQQAGGPFWATLDQVRVCVLAFAEHEFNVAPNGFSGANILDAVRCYESIEAVRATADMLLVLVHGGSIRQRLPHPRQRRMCRFIVDVGADVVLCHGSHVAGPVETHRGKFICYGLGNFAFGGRTSNPRKQSDGALALIDVRGPHDATVSMLPIVAGSDMAPRLSLADERQAFQQAVDQASEVLPDEAAYARAWLEYCQGRKGSILNRVLIPGGPWKGAARLLQRMPWLGHALTRKRRDLEILNHVRCDAHREEMQAVLEGFLANSLGARPLS